MAPEQQSVFLERYATLYRQYTFETAAAAEAADPAEKSAPGPGPVGATFD